MPVGSDRPCYSIELSEISPAVIGGLFYFMECLTVYVAQLSKVNPFDQPGVEDGKKMTYALMGREDHALRLLLLLEPGRLWRQSRQGLEGNLSPVAPLTVTVSVERPIHLPALPCRVPEATVSSQRTRRPAR